VEVGVAISVFPRLGPTGPILGSHVLLIQRGMEPGKGLYSLPGGRQELGETLAETALRELREEVVDARGRGLRAHVADAVCPCYTATDAIFRASHTRSDGLGDEEKLSYHYTIVHVLAWLDIAPSEAPRDGRGVLQLPRLLHPLQQLQLPAVRCASDAADAMWVRVDPPSRVTPPPAGPNTEAQMEGACSAPHITEASGRSASLAALHAAGLLVPWTADVLALAAPAWRARAYDVLS
jgi:hypothetical protein